MLTLTERVLPEEERWPRLPRGACPGDLLNMKPDDDDDDQGDDDQADLTCGTNVCKLAHCFRLSPACGPCITVCTVVCKCNAVCCPTVDDRLMIAAR